MEVEALRIRRNLTNGMQTILTRSNSDAEIQAHYTETRESFFDGADVEMDFEVQQAESSSKHTQAVAKTREIATALGPSAPVLAEDTANSPLDDADVDKFFHSPEQQLLSECRNDTPSRAHSFGAVSTLNPLMNMLRFKPFDQVEEYESDATSFNIGKLPDPVSWKGHPTRRPTRKRIVPVREPSDSSLSESSESDSDGSDSDTDSPEESYKRVGSMIRSELSEMDSNYSASETDSGFELDAPGPEGEGLPRALQRQASARKQMPVEIQVHEFQENQTFELIIGDRALGSYDRVVFEVCDMIEASSPSESSYLRGTMYIIRSDYVNPPVFGEDQPESAVPHDGTEVFLLNPGTRDAGAAVTRRSFLIDISLGKIVYVVRRMGPIIWPNSQDLPEEPYVLRCSWIYTAMKIGQGECFSPIYSGTEELPPMPSRMGVADFFCGTGGFSEGFRRAGFSISFGVDKDGNAAESWKCNHPSADVHCEDVNTLIEERERGTISLPQVHVALISPPCQGFSTANPGGKNDENNRGLLDSVCDIAPAFRPYWLVMENVPGLTHPKHVLHLRKLQADLMSLGYMPTWAIQCASNFGVPQTRRRVVLFATMLGLTRPEFPATTHAWNSPAHLPLVNLRTAISDLNHENPRIHNASWNPRYTRPRDEDGCSSTEYRGVIGSQTKEITYHATGYSHFSDTTKIPRAEWDTPSSTVRTMLGNRWKCVHPDGKRVLTVREVLRIQSFRDDWYLFGPIKEQYRQVGNAVPPLLSEAWAREVRTAALTDYPVLEGFLS
ncbi:S-adenosyl-L-methionine-dependent methyltransferase [Mycena crocata]|nr:S-adenosyl-L-methionine-dependent methyltransferase [Mycena crocata]